MSVRFVGATVMAAMVLASGALAEGAMSTEDLLRKHLDAFGAGDVEGLIADYAEDGVVLMQDGSLDGRDAIRGMLEGLVAEFSQPGTAFAMDTSKVDDNVAYIVWHAETPDNVYEYGTDTFVFVDGKIQTQTLTFKAIPK